MLKHRFMLSSTNVEVIDLDNIGYVEFSLIVWTMKWETKLLTKCAYCIIFFILVIHLCLVLCKV